MSSRYRSVLAPRMLGAHLLAVVLVAIAVGLGFWQLGAWTAEREAQAVDLTQEAPVPIGDVMSPDDGFPTVALGRPVEVAGTWVPQDSLVITGRGTDTGEPGDGVWAVTPVAVDGEDGAQLLVVRGWAADAADLPAPPDGAADLVVRPQPSQDDQGVVDPDVSDRELPQLRIAAAVQLSDANLYGGFAVAAEPQAGLAEVEVPPQEEVGTFTGLQNFLYAVEWWVFGGFALFVWWRFVRDAIEADAAVEAAAGGPEPEPAADLDRTPVG